MDCPLKSKDGAELIVAYGAGTLAPEMQFALERHLEGCAECRETAEAQKQVWETLDFWTPPPVSNTFNEVLYQRIAAKDREGWWHRMFGGHWSWRPAMPVAAACAALIAVFLLKGPLGEVASSPQPAPAPAIEQVERALDDMDMLKQLGVASMPEGSPSADRL